MTIEEIDVMDVDELVERFNNMEKKLKENEQAIKEAHESIKEGNDALLKSIKTSDDLNNKYLRALADYQNLQRISNERISNSKNDGIMSVIKNIFPILDDFERVEKSGELTDGVNIIYSKFKNILKEYNVEEINPLTGDHFDDSLHEAIAAIPGGEHDTIMETNQKGYKVGNKVLRYAKVAVYV